MIMLTLVLTFCAWFGGIIIFAGWLFILSLCKCASRRTPSFPSLPSVKIPTSEKEFAVSRSVPVRRSFVAFAMPDSGTVIFMPLCLRDSVVK
jgi:hypothetical protein